MISYLFNFLNLRLCIKLLVTGRSMYHLVVARNVVRIHHHHHHHHHHHQSNAISIYISVANCSLQSARSSWRNLPSAICKKQYTLQHERDLSVPWEKMWLDSLCPYDERWLGVQLTISAYWFGMLLRKIMTRSTELHEEGRKDVSFRGDDSFFLSCKPTISPAPPSSG